MVALWAATTSAYNITHGTDLIATVDFGGKVKGRASTSKNCR